jgi:hypothetical protein
MREDYEDRREIIERTIGVGKLCNMKEREDKRGEE